MYRIIVLDIMMM